MEVGRRCPCEAVRQSFALTFVAVEGLITAVIDMYPKRFRQKNRRELLILFFSIVSYLIGLVMLTEGGIYVFQLFDYYAASGMCLLFIAMFQSICIGWVYGADKFYHNIEHMIGYRPLPLIKCCWQFVTPALCLATFLFSVIKYTPLTYNKKYVYPWWADAVGWMLAISSIICIPLWILYKLCSVKGSLTERLRQLTSPDVELPQFQKIILSDPSQRPSEAAHLATAVQESHC
ncbi:hypothetical protein NDU88_006398 [Pleurodeles waltl]|uniref:Sodium- and chloride-dependent GABA transporter 2 n=1 Tax=Pleurodeles waltl TaxID=8319 RepID=A0AAV7SPF0_PLEWA|nr:hypothetical protein NDU88_006398 [Pleurodeles waltl]